MAPDLIVQFVTELQSHCRFHCAAAFPSLQDVEHTQGFWLLRGNKSPQVSLQEVEV